MIFLFEENELQSEKENVLLTCESRYFVFMLLT